MSEEIFSLTEVKENAEVIFVSAEGGRILNKRLADMGLKKGLKLKVLHSHKPGPCVVLVNGTRLVIGRGMGSKVMVKRI